MREQKKKDICNKDITFSEMYSVRHNRERKEKKDPTSFMNDYEIAPG